MKFMRRKHRRKRFRISVNIVTETSKNSMCPH